MGERMENFVGADYVRPYHFLLSVHFWGFLRAAALGIFI